MRILLALLALSLSVGASAACERHMSHTAVLASVSTPIAPMPKAVATVTALPQSRVVEEAAMPLPGLATSPYGRGCRNERRTTVYLTQ